MQQIFIRYSVDSHSTWFDGTPFPIPMFRPSMFDFDIIITSFTGLRRWKYVYVQCHSYVQLLLDIKSKALFGFHIFMISVWKLDFELCRCVKDYTLNFLHQPCLKNAQPFLFTFLIILIGRHVSKPR